MRRACLRAKWHDHLCAGPASRPIGEPEVAAESLYRGLREQEADPGALLAFGREKALSRLGPRDSALQARSPVLDQDPQILRAPAAVHLHFLIRCGVGGVV